LAIKPPEPPSRSVANPGIANLAKQAQQALSDENRLPSCARTTLETLVRHRARPLLGRAPMVAPLKTANQGVSRL
jgi:hypothetical protein